MRVLATTLVAAVGFTAPAFASTWEIDPVHSTVQFKVRHLMISDVRGEFGKTSGSIQLDDKDPIKSNVEATIDVASISTHNDMRDKHLKSPDFFDVEKFPTMTFKSTKVESVGSGKYKVSGNLTLHGVTKPVVLDVDSFSPEIKDPFGNVKRGLSASAQINRKDFGLTWNKVMEGGGMMVGEDIKINLDLELAKKGPPAKNTAKK